MDVNNPTSSTNTQQQNKSHDESVWSGGGSCYNGDLPADSTDHWPESMQRSVIQVPMELWNVLGQRRLHSAENVYGAKNLSQTERRELEETWTMVQTNDVRFDRYPPEAIPRTQQLINFIPVRGFDEDNIASHVENIDEDEEFFRKQSEQKSRMKEFRKWVRRLCCVKKPPSPQKPPPPKPAVRTFQVKIRDDSTATPKISTQSSVVTNNPPPPRRLVQHSLMVEHPDPFRSFNSGRYTAGLYRHPKNDHPIYNYNPIGYMPMSSYSPTEFTFASHGHCPSHMSSAVSGLKYGIAYDGSLMPNYQYRPESNGRWTPSGGSRGYSPHLPQGNRQRPPQVHAQRFGPQAGGYVGGNSHERYERRPYRPFHIAHNANFDVTPDDEELGNISGFSGVQPAAYLQTHNFPQHVLFSSPVMVPSAVPEVPKHEPNPGMAVVRESTSVPRLGVYMQSSDKIAQMQTGEIVTPNEQETPTKIPWTNADCHSIFSFQSEVEEILSLQLPVTPKTITRPREPCACNTSIIDEELTFDESVMDHGLTPPGM